MRMDVLPASDPRVRRALEDFRVEHEGAAYVVRLKGEGKMPSAAFPEVERGGQVLMEFIPRADWQRAGLIRRWVTAARPAYLALSFLPLLLVASAYFAQHGFLPALETALLFASILLIHVSCHFWGDYEDHLRGVDALDRASGSGVIQRLWIPAVHLRNAAALLFATGFALGLWLLTLVPLAQVGLPLLTLGALGAFGAASYSGWPFHYKYLGLGEPIVFFLSGPVITAGAELLLFGTTAHLYWAIGVSLPLSFLATLRLHGGNMQRIPFDTAAGARTISRMLGFRWSKFALGFLLVAPYVLTLLLVGAWVMRPWALSVVFTLPLAVLAFRPLWRAAGPLDPAMHLVRRWLVQLHWAFGAIYVLSPLF